MLFMPLERPVISEQNGRRKRRALACSMGYPSARSVVHHHTAVAPPAGVQCH